MTKTNNKMRKRKMWGWSLAIALLLPMTACQEDTDLKQGSDATKKTLEEVFISNNPADFEGRVTNFKATKAVVRSVADAYGVPAMPEQPEVPAGAISMDGYQSWNCQPNTAYVLEAGKSHSGDVNMNGNTYYIQGKLTLTNYWGTGTFVILPGGTLVYPKNRSLDNNVKVYNYGTFTLSGKDFTTNTGSTFMTQGDFACEGKLHIGGDFYVEGNLDAPTLNANNDLRLFVGGKATFQKAEITNQSTIYLEKLKADELEVNSASTVTVGCSAYINKKFYLTNGIDFRVLGYLQSPVTELNSNAKLSVNSGCWMSLGDLSIRNANSVNISVAGEDGAYGVVEAKNISVNLNNLRGTFTGYMGLHYETLKGNGSQAEIQFLSQVLINDDDDTSIAATECSPAFNYTPGSSNGGKEEIVIDHIAEVTSPDLDHTHDISATCVQMAGNKAYVSYHRQGPDYSGCVEVMEVAADQVTLKSYMRSEEARDFNHLIVDNNRIYAVGGDNKGGALIATIGLTDGVFQSGDADGLEVIRLKGNGNETVHDANCIVRNGNYYQVASTNGFATLQADNLEEVNFVATPGSAKFVHTDGQGNLVTLNLGDKNDVQSAAVVNRYNAQDYNFANATLTLNDGIIKPVDGKNVCKVDGSNIYLCLGQNGFKRYTDGTPNGGFSLEGTNAAVNGMDYDDRYLYLAYGSEGLYVLDKETLDVVASYTHSGGKSANYVKVDGGYIYVAYGRNGLQVFKLTTKK